MPVVPMNEFKTALKSIRKMRNVFMLVIIIALLVQIGGFLAVETGGVLKPRPRACSAGLFDSTTQPTSQPVCEKSRCSIHPKTWHSGLNWLLPISKQAAFFAAIMLAITLGIGAHFSMLGPSPRGIHHMISAFFWSVILVLALTPWQQVMPDSMICGATFSLGDIVNAQARQAGNSLGFLTLYARFMAYPILAIVIWLAVAVKFRRASRKLIATQSPEVKAANINDVD